MKLLTQKIEKSLPELYGTQQVEPEDKIARVKYFTPWSNWTWYGVEYDPEDRLFYGYVEGLEKEWGYFSLTELETVNGPFGLKIERDLYFHPTPISDLIN